jgi:Telomere resolvase ResT/TelK catalytic domain
MATIKAWLRARWVLLDAALEPLTVEQEEEIARICQEEMDYWSNERGASLGTIGNLVSQTRKHLSERFPVLNDSNSWFNTRAGVKEHLSLKYINLSKEEWAARVAPSQEKQEARLQDRKFIDDPDLVVSRAVGLLDSGHWQDITVALAVLTGRRLHELLDAGSFTPRMRYTLTFKGQLKVRDKVMPPYEIPVLCEGSLVLAAVDRLRSLIAAGSADEDSLGGIADRHFSDIVPPRSGGNLYVHLFRAVYGAIAVFYFCKREVLDTVYLNRIYGHYWIAEAEGTVQANYNATQHYQDYGIGDAAVLAHGGQRQGVKLSDPGVTLLEIFQEKTEAQKENRKMQQVERPTRKPSKTGFSSAKPSEETRARLDDIWVEIAARIDDDVLKLLCDEHYELKTLTAFGASLTEIVSLLADAASDSETPVQYLSGLLKSKRDFKKSYSTRHQGKDYSGMRTSELRNHKSAEAAAERFGRAVDAIKAYNESVEFSEMRWYINAAVICELVGGAPGIAKEWLKSRPDVVEHHKEYKLAPGFNRRGVSIKERVTVPELPDRGISEPEPELSASDVSEPELEEVEPTEVEASE